MLCTKIPFLLCASSVLLRVSSCLPCVPREPKWSLVIRPCFRTLSAALGMKMAVPQQSPPISIRRRTSVDAPGILACLREAFQAYRQFYTTDAYLDTVLTQ